MLIDTRFKFSRHSNRGQAFIELVIVLTLFATSILICMGGLKNAKPIISKTGLERFP